jgi:ATP-binding cassette subfamily B protein
LSGGQKQRIGIARALYKDANVIIFDEATSALDRKTESLVLENLKNISSKVTIFIVTHRVDTLKNCDQVIRIDDSGCIQ